MTFRKNQRQADHHVLHQSLRAKADGQADDGRARQIRRQADTEFLQHKSDGNKIDGKGDAAGNEPGERDEFRLLGHEAERVFLRLAFVDEPFGDVPDDFDCDMHKRGEGHNEQQVRSQG